MSILTWMKWTSGFQSSKPQMFLIIIWRVNTTWPSLSSTTCLGMTWFPHIYPQVMLLKNTKDFFFLWVAVTEFSFSAVCVWQAGVWNRHTWKRGVSDLSQRAGSARTSERDRALHRGPAEGTRTSTALHNLGQLPIVSFHRSMRNITYRLIDSFSFLFNTLDVITL